MIVTGLLTLLTGFLTVLLSPLEMLPLPDGVEAVLASGMQYIVNGFEILAAYTHITYLLSLFSFVLSFEMIYLGYKVIMWIIRKIPFFGLS